MSGLSWTLHRRLHQQASLQLDNGMTLSQVLGEFGTHLARHGHKHAAEAADEVARRVVDGDLFVLALGDDFPDLERSVLSAGDQADQLPDSMRLVTEVRDLITCLRQKLQASFSAPSICLVSLYVVLLPIGVSIVPQFLDVLPLSKWTDWAYAMHLMGDLAVGWPTPICFGGPPIYAAWSWWALPCWIGLARAFCDRRLLPFAMYRKIAGLAWLLSFVTLLHAGIPDTVALDNQAASASSWLALCLGPIRSGLIDGPSLPEAMRATGYGFPSPDLIDEIGAYAGPGDFTDKIAVTVRQYVRVIERQLLARGMLMSAVFTGFMFLASVALQLGANSLSSTLTPTVGQI